VAGRGELLIAGEDEQGREEGDAEHWGTSESILCEPGRSVAPGPTVGACRYPGKREMLPRGASEATGSHPPRVGWGVSAGYPVPK
jgi:hypothetical protein